MYCCYVCFVAYFDSYYDGGFWATMGPVGWAHATWTPATNIPIKLDAPELFDSGSWHIETFVVGRIIENTTFITVLSFIFQDCILT